jgi:hypothetical protein
MAKRKAKTKRKTRWIWKCYSHVGYCRYYLNRSERLERNTDDECLKYSESCPSRKLVEVKLRR